jgi:hypothetical protein
MNFEPSLPSSPSPMLKIAGKKRVEIEPLNLNHEP